VVIIDIFAYLELGKKEIDCAIAGDFSTVFFYLADHVFSSLILTSEKLKKPELKLHNIEEFLQNFLKNPETDKQKNGMHPE